ncbi:RE1-silencing transcription factor [Spea bombifrons]|uniref:RE1-silencing transcription factor n=1 Tax=Spea bombifrons TaxID=233779 RepID=UPI00234B47F4|nr:RE1-silencing transcription factor [Spea bombifrons]
MATQMVSQTTGSNPFCSNGNFGISLDGDMYGLHDLSKADMAAPRLIMLANVALTGEVSSNCCDYIMEEERQMAELTTVNDNSFSDSDSERVEDSNNTENDSGAFQIMEMETPDQPKDKECDIPLAVATEGFGADLEKDADTPTATEDKNKCLKSKPFRCKPCQYRAENEEEFVLHIKSHSAKPYIDDTPKDTHPKESDSCMPDDADFSKGPIRCDRCGYNTNRFDHYLAHLKHHNKVGENERVYKCTICTYTTVSEYHWKKHLRNHFPRIVYTCSQCSYFSDRKNNYIQHIRTHTGERPYQCDMCPYSSSQKTHLTRHMRTHSGEKPFKCEQCSYVASNQHEVTRHARQVHNGPKPLTCPHCDYKTADRSNFKKHVELHVNPRQFLCPVCDYAASKKCNLQYHIKSRHSGCSDITMDVSKVKLRTKKGEAGVLDDTTSIPDDSAKIKETEGKKPDKTIKVEKKENSVKSKKQIADTLIGQVTRSGRRSLSQTKPEQDDASPEIPTRVKCGKRRATSPADSVRPNATQTGITKKKKSVQKNKLSQEVVIKELKMELPQRQKVDVKKNKENKLVKKQKKSGMHGSDKKKIKSKRTIPEQNNEKNDSCKEQPPVNETDPPVGVYNGCFSIQEHVEVSVEGSTTKPEEPSAEDMNSKAEEPITDNCTNHNNDVSMPSSPQGVSNKQNELLTINSEEFVVQDNENSITSPGSPVCDLQIKETSYSNVVSDVILADNSTEPLHCQDTLSADIADRHKPQHMHSEPCNDPQSTCNLENITDQQRGNPSEELLYEVLKDMSKSPDLDASEEVGEQQMSKETGNLEINMDLEEEDRTDEPCNMVNTELVEKDNRQKTCYLEMNVKLNGSDKPKICSSLELNTEEQETDQSSGNQSTLVECCSGNIQDHDAKGIPASESQCNGSSSEEDEGIHSSHDGSDISDSVSERSDDSGLNGVPSVQETQNTKSTVELNSSETNILKEKFVCIFCDRAFKKEEEYTKHLKRHLVNVYYLENASQSQT